jgi:hypothetical protein
MPVIDIPPVTRDGARSAAQRELSKAVYHRYDDPWPVRAFKAVAHWLGRLLDGVSRHAPGGGAGAVALLVALAILLVAARWRLGPVRRTPRLARSVLGTSTASAADHRREAVAAAAAGRWAEAVVARMRAIARGLEESDQLPVRPGRTADELAAEVSGSRPDAATAIARAATVFDEVAYGNRPGSAEAYGAVVTADELLGRSALTGTGRR